MKVTKIEVFHRKFEFWFDPTVQVWYAIERSEAGNQIGETMDAPTRDLILIFIGVRAGEVPPKPAAKVGKVKATDLNQLRDATERGEALLALLPAHYRMIASDRWFTDLHGLKWKNDSDSWFRFDGKTIEQRIFNTNRNAGDPSLWVPVAVVGNDNLV